MASSSQERQALPNAQVATPPDSPSHGSPPKHAESNQPIVTKIEKLLSEMKRDPGLAPDSQTAPSIKARLERLVTARDGESSDTAVDTSKLSLVATRTPPNTPRYDGSEPVTIRQLIELLEAAVEAKRMSSSHQTGLADCEHEKHSDSRECLVPMKNPRKSVPILLHQKQHFRVESSLATEIWTIQIQRKVALRPNRERCYKSPISKNSVVGLTPHPMIWDHLFGRDAVNQERVGSLGVESSPSLPTTQRLTSPELLQGCTPIPTVRTPGDDVLDDQEESGPANTQSSPRMEKASRLEVKKVRQIWNKALGDFTHRSADEEKAVDELDTYVLVERFEIDRNGKEMTHVDIKSAYLQDVLRAIFKDVKAVNLRGDKSMSEPHFLFQFLPDLEAHREQKTKDTAENQVAHLDLVISYIREKYASLSQQIYDLLQHGEITYDLLWFLFKPNEIVYTTCDGTGKPRCLRFGIGEEKTTLFGPIFNLDCQYLDSDGEKVGFASIDLNIPKFAGVAYHYHPQKGKVKADLIACGKKFYSLRGSHHYHCKGKAFVVQDDVKVKRNIDSRVMIDAAFFRRMKPNYQQPKIETTLNPGAFDPSAHMMQGFEEISFVDLFPEVDPRDHGWDRDHSPVFNTSEAIATSVRGSADEEYLICSPTIPGFCLSDKFWGEFAVMDIEDIVWSTSLFDRLDIKPEYKELIIASAMSRLGIAEGPRFDDIVPGKGRGLSVMLHGAPGLGKTLTAQAVAEQLQRPLYSVSAGELLHNAGVLEERLQGIFATAKHWNALLLLDEADVFLETRTEKNHFMNGIVAVFLRMLEWFEGVMFLTTNRASNFDPAILSRIHITVEYPGLKQDQRMGIWRSSLDRARTVRGPSDLSDEEINNIVSVGHALAAVKAKQLQYHYVQKAVEMSQKFMNQVNGTEQVNSYFN
ncbi:conserved hypothetical protein [Talaromyces stipitatus ATCC 10500]|uniref:AAA+ ATPase domain-containing protein n=1 Tax=Talaromyces stipitatus (strain ATCC 10500 / CBS 375.48 / QM 6759 / NRRL 1006) TaxID=441959 RepID=B8MV71_TALSN|nr:uncharacterized protein TSTA_008230 [Talaromyces stipitatus ATCC 10500]EED11527.1 conserved hypothetical protein [Talaromyces stipitatus ATCC 10500]